MDDDDEEEEGEEEEEEEEDEGDEEEDDGDEEGGDDPEAKIKAVKADIALIHDVFSYIDKTTRRITTQMASTNKIKELEEKLTNNNNNTNYPVHHDDDMSLHWSQYEDMDESQRAELLERAIMVLGNDQSEVLQPQPPRANNNIRKGDYRKK